VVPNGVDTELFCPPSKPPARAFEGFTVVFTGGLEPWQGIDLLLRGIHAIRERDSTPVYAIIAGDGPARRSLERLAAELGLADDVRFVGSVPRDAVPGVIASGDLGYSGHTESQGRAVFRSPLKLYEYMAMAKPVLSSSVADARQLVTPGETGFLFDAASEDSFVQALRLAVAARDTLPAMGERARRSVVAHHSWTARCQKVIADTKRIALELT
jgi:glycosyltransferase involved in cell wall biosynthesis